MSLNNLHCICGNGCKKCHYTEALFFPHVNNTLLSLDSNFSVIWIDLNATFDTVVVDLALRFLENETAIQGIALCWFKSFLSGRKQPVSIGNSLSEAVEVLYGVRQGSVLGPILFNTD